MKPEETVEVLIVAHHEGANASTDCDEAIARALEAEEGGVTAGSGAGQQGGSRQGALADAGPAPAADEVQGPDAPSAPPLPCDPRSPGSQERAGEPAGPGAAPAQLAEDEQLARSLHDEELQRLSEEQRGG
jgi:hypothetical protein